MTTASSAPKENAEHWPITPAMATPSNTRRQLF
jgi:hypothetical protein